MTLAIRTTVMDKDSYPHDSRADNDSYRHDDNDSYRHDGRADKNPYPHDRHSQCLMLRI